MSNSQIRLLASAHTELLATDDILAMIEESLKVARDDYAAGQLSAARFQLQNNIRRVRAAIDEETQ